MYCLPTWVPSSSIRIPRIQGGSHPLFSKAWLLILFSFLPFSCCTVPETFTRPSKCPLLLGNIFSIPPQWSTTGLQFACVRGGSFVQKDGLESNSARLQERIRLRTLAHITPEQKDTWPIWISLFCALRALLPTPPWGSPLLCILPQPMMVYGKKFAGQQAMCLLQTVIRRRERRAELQGV